MNDEWTQPCDMCCNARITYLYYGDTNLHYSRCIINCTLWNKSDRFLFGWHHFRWPPVAFQSNCIIQHFLLLLLFSRCLSLSAIRPVLYRPCHHNFVAWYFFFDIIHLWSSVVCSFRASFLDAWHKALDYYACHLGCLNGFVVASLFFLSHRMQCISLIFRRFLLSFSVSLLFLRSHFVFMLKCHNHGMITCAIFVHFSELNLCDLHSFCNTVKVTNRKSFHLCLCRDKHMRKRNSAILCKNIFWRYVYIKVDSLYWSNEPTNSYYSCACIIIVYRLSFSAKYAHCSIAKYMLLYYNIQVRVKYCRSLS